RPDERLQGHPPEVDPPAREGLLRRRLTSARMATFLSGRIGCDATAPLANGGTEMTGSLAPPLEKPRTNARLRRPLTRIAAAHRELTLAVAAIAALALHVLD